MTRNQIAFASLQEDKRHNQEMESQGRSGVTETERSNRAREAENYRSNTAREYETRRHNLINEAETNRSNVANEANVYYRNVTDRARLGETQRSNLANEELKGQEQINKMTIDIGNLNRQNLASSADVGLKQAQQNLVNKEVQYYDQNENRKEASGVVKFISDVFETAAKVGSTLGSVLH